jgi:hypothetical protein
MSSQESDTGAEALDQRVGQPWVRVLAMSSRFKQIR